MNPTKSEIKEWLKTNHLSYGWLAEQCLVSENTVRGWMAKKDIPSAKLKLIASMMNGDKEDDEEEIILRFSEEEMVIINRFRELYPNTDIREYLRTKAIEFCIGMESAAMPTASRTRSTIIDDEEIERLLEADLDSPWGERDIIYGKAKPSSDQAL